MPPNEKHKIRPGQEGLIQVELLPRQGTARPGQLVAIHGTGATVRFACSALPGLALQSEVCLRFMCSRFARPVELVSSANSRRDDGLFSTYEFWFANPREAEERIVPHLKTIFNERSAVRAKPETGKPIEVRLDSDPAGDLAVGRLVDLSTHGLSMKIDTRDEPKFVAAWHAKVSFRLPGSLLPFALPSVIRHRRSTGGEVQLGIEFRVLDDAEYHSQRERIAGWVLLRQQTSAPRTPPPRVMPRRAPPAA